MLQPKSGQPPSLELAELEELIQARRKFSENGVALKSGLGQAELSLVKRQLRARIKQNATHLLALEQAAMAIIKMNFELKQRYRILCSTPGGNFFG